MLSELQIQLIEVEVEKIKLCEEYEFRLCVVQNYKEQLIEFERVVVQNEFEFKIGEFKGEIEKLMIENSDLKIEVEKYVIEISELKSDLEKLLIENSDLKNFIV